eukprot:449245-Amphidinium_carterae.1
MAEMQRRLDSTATALTTGGLHLNGAKCSFVCNKWITPAPMHVQGAPLIHAASFKFLGSVYTAEGSSAAQGRLGFVEAPPQ